jgi:hypothetical protein
MEKRIAIIGPAPMELIDRRNDIEIVEVEQPERTLFSPEPIPFVLRPIPEIGNAVPRNRAERRRSKYKSN